MKIYITYDDHSVACYHSWQKLKSPYSLKRSRAFFCLIFCPIQPERTNQRTPPPRYSPWGATIPATILGTSEPLVSLGMAGE